MQTPSKTDLETLAIRLGCPPHLVEGGVVFTLVADEPGVRRQDPRDPQPWGRWSPPEPSRSGYQWYLMAGTRQVPGRPPGYGCSTPGWSKSIDVGIDVDVAGVCAFWTLWDSVGDLDPETKQAGRERNVAVKRDAAAESGWTRAATLQEWFALHPVGSTVGYGIAGEGIGLGAHLRPAPPRHLDVSVRPCFWMVMNQPERGS